MRLSWSTWQWAVVVLAVLAPSSARARGNAGKEKLSLADLIEQAEPSCVRLDMTLRKGKSIGSGFVVNKKGWIVTNYHVVAGAVTGAATFADGTKAPIEGYLAHDERRDVAVVKIKTNRALVPLTLSKTLPRKGETAIAISAPQGLSFTATEGMISAIRKGSELKAFGTEADGTWLQTSTPISPGSSGGPLFNLQGEVVGANAATLQGAQNLNFAISATEIAGVIIVAGNSRVADLAKLDPPPASRATIPSPGGTAVRKLPAERRFSHPFRIAKEEDEFDKLAWLRTPWLPLAHNDRRLTSRGLRVGVPYREDNPSPAVIWELGTTSRSFSFIGPGSRRFQLLVDGEPVQLSEPKHKGDVGPGKVSERMTTLLTLEGFLELIMAKEVKARLGKMEYRLTKEQLECLRDLASRLPEGATGEGLRVERYAVDEDPSVPPALAARFRKKNQPKAVAKPAEKPRDEFRTWRSVAGNFSIEARLVKVEGNTVHLRRKEDDKEISVPLDKLSAADREFAGKNR